MRPITEIDPRATSYAITGAMKALERRFEVVADNLANVETNGHKRLIAYSIGSSDDSSAAQGTESIGAELERDFTQGDLIESGDPADLALNGEGFFAVQVDADIRYVRTARLFRDPEGTLRDGKGAQLLGESGPISVPTEAVDLRVEKDGTVTADLEAVGKLRVVTFVDPTELNAVGGGRYAASSSAELVAATATDVASGFRERSNTDPVSELVEMILIQRQYEAAQRALSTESELRRSLNELSG